MRTGFEVQKNGATTGASRGLFEGQNLRVLHSVVDMSGFTGFFRGWIDDHRAHGGIRRGQADTGPRQVERPAHVMEFVAHVS